MRSIRTWQLLLVFVLFFALSIYLLRQNNLNMIKLREAVKTADLQNSDVQGALSALQQYVTSHMNTNLGEGIYLEKTYQRAYDRAVQAKLQVGSSSSTAYQQADRDCRAVFSNTYSFQAYIQCVTAKITALGSAQDPLAGVKAPSTDLYRHNFASPIWTPDLAGWTVLITILLFIIILIKLLLTWILYLITR